MRSSDDGADERLPDRIAEGTEGSHNMKVLLVNGSPHEHGCTYTALKEAADTLEKNGTEAEIMWIGKDAMYGCSACGYCKRSGKGCIRKDSVNDVLERIDSIDGFVFGAPVYYSGPDGQLTAWMDRLFYASVGRMAGKVAASVVSCRRGGASAAFERLNQYYLMSRMIVPGATYWNQVHGDTPDEVRQDLEGMQNMRILAGYIAWILKCIDAGRKAGVPAPPSEAKVFTNFIR